MSERRQHESKPSRKKRAYPVARPYAPPPGPGGVPLPLPPRQAPAPRPLPRTAPRHQQPEAPEEEALGTPAKLVLLGAVLIACVVLGWFLFRGPGAKVLSSLKEEQVAANGNGITTRPEPGAEAAPTKPERPSSRPPTPQPRPETKPERPETKPENRPAALTFVRDVRPILEKKCFQCHGADKQSAKIDVRSVASLKRGNKNGPALVPGAPDKSSLWTTVEGGMMPPGGKNPLSAAEAKALKDWILSGASE